MALETLSSTELLNFIVYNSINPSSSSSQQPAFLFDNNSTKSPDASAAVVLTGASEKKGRTSGGGEVVVLVPKETSSVEMVNAAAAATAAVVVVQGRKKRRRRERVCKNKEEAENQRMTHIAVERNRRKMMNEHLAVLRSLMPESYAQRGDQASIVGGAIEFVKELEQHLQTLEAKKFLLLQQSGRGGGGAATTSATAEFLPSSTATDTDVAAARTIPFSQFFAYPQYMCSLSPPPVPPPPHQSQYNCKSSNNNKEDVAIADIEVTLIETHANVRILSRKRVKQLSKLVTAFHSMYLTILHLNVTTLEPMVLYSISAKVEEGCLLSSADDIAGAVHHILRIIEESHVTLCCQNFHV